MTTIAVLGLGEAGRLYAAGLRSAGAQVRGFDPYRPHSGDDVVHSIAEAVAGADVVVSLVGATAAVDVAAQALPAMAATAVYADLNTAAPEIKEQVARLAALRGVAMADAAVLAPVPRAGHRTDLIASGPAATALAARLAPFGVPVEVIDAPAGEAARLKLLRSVFMKGLATLIIEALGAARASGAEEWLRGQLADELGTDGVALVDRLVSGTYQHAARRAHEVRDALALLEASDLPADMTRATLAWFERILGPDQSV